MNKILLLFLIFISSCANQDRLCSSLDEIKTLGDETPLQALSKLDSISSLIIGAPKHTMMKYELLRIRLSDKAYITHNSDKKIKELLNYFSSYGNTSEKQEVYYYAGSTYRDLEDTPNALKYFLLSKEIGEKYKKTCDSIMLQNTYSNLSYLFGNVQDNQNLLYYAKEEFKIASQQNRMTETCLMHLGDALLANDSASLAIRYYDQAYEKLIVTQEPNRDILSSLVYNYSYTKQFDKVERCANLLIQITGGNYDLMTDKELKALGEYFLLKDINENAIKCFQQVMKYSTDPFSIYDASRRLYHIYRKLGDTKMTIFYSNEFIKACGVLNLGKRQELAATVNNIYKYNKDKEEEEKLIQENQSYHTQIKILIQSMLILIISIILIILYYRYIQLKKIVNLNKKIEGINKEKDELAKVLLSKEKDLTQSKNQLNQIIIEAANTQMKLNEARAKQEKLSYELESKEAILKEKIKQNKTIISLMHQTEFEINAEDVIQNLKKSGNGTSRLTDKGWHDLYAAIDKLCPDFKEQMISNLGTVTDQQRQFCYLKRAGFSNTQVQNITELSRVTIWRWSKKYDWINANL